ncbi:MAG: diaminopimelate epimerase, partial [Nitrospirae bacterium]|nr:diaminopimelate epimerase [Nitrospirota bacterium]
MKLQFTKMHALGNDFIVIDNRKLKLKNFSRLSKKLCHRKFGIGADQLLALCNSKKADFKMRIFNPDGGEAEMCGNGIRCLAKYIWDKKIKSEKLKVKSLKIETLAGVIHIEKKDSLIKVDLGEPVFEPEKIPVRISQESGVRSQELPPFNSPLDKGGHRGVYNEIINYPLQVDDRKFKITCISMGNPHAVIVVNDAASFPVSLYGPVIEKHGMFPKKTNVEIIQVLNRKNI